MSKGRVKVLYIAGMSRSGSTILGNILGGLEGFLHVGEIRYIWERNLISDAPCGCGVQFRQCPVWRKVLANAFGGGDGINPQKMIELRDANLRTRHLPLMFTPGGERRLKLRLEDYLANLQKLYYAIQYSTNCNVIVDSSLFPSYGRVLESLPTIDYYVVHLIRDSRAVAYSMRKKRPDMDTGNMYMDRMGSVQSSLLWTASNVAAEAFWNHVPKRRLMLRYEDLMEKPQEAVRCIANLVQEDIVRLPFESEHKVRIGTNHTLSGNPARFNGGTVELRTDTVWQTEIKQFDRVAATTLTLPLLLKYGYLH